jgi:hypothetical protein
MNVRDYRYLYEVLSLPRELIAYFDFRQNLLLRKPSMYWPEAKMAAQFVSETDEPLPEEEVREVLRAAAYDTTSFDIGPVLKRFGDKVTYLEGSGADLDYYRILAEFTRLDRADMRGFKRRSNGASRTPGETTQKYLPECNAPRLLVLWSSLAMAVRP